MGNIKELVTDEGIRIMPKPDFISYEQIQECLNSAHLVNEHKGLLYATANKGADNTLEQWWYLGGNFKLSNNSSIWPHIGLVHSWMFDQDADLAAGFFYVYKQYSLYLWGNDFFKEHPRLTMAVDFTF